jgi:hypothetical protein
MVPTAATPSYFWFADQGLTLIHSSAQRKRFLWDRGCVEGLFRGIIAGFKGY